MKRSIYFIIILSSRLVCMQTILHDVAKKRLLAECPGFEHDSQDIETIARYISQLRRIQTRNIQAISLLKNRNLLADFAVILQHLKKEPLFKPSQETINRYFFVSGFLNAIMRTKLDMVNKRIDSLNTHRTVLEQQAQRRTFLNKKSNAFCMHIEEKSHKFEQIIRCV